ncbi:MAG: hypothetical protein KGZ79_06020 [Dethiobacter sp.]|jgi:hypothetical protein|nr:hypothetical protein [Dethiobacter sp.]
MPEICIAVHNGMLSAALAVRDLNHYYSPVDTKAIRERKYQAWETTYPAWYLFGSVAKNTAGLVELYSRQGFAVSLCPQSELELQLNAGLALLDVQFCTLDDSLCRKFTAANTKISGYLPAILAGKNKQTSEFYRQGLSLFLPTQKSYTYKSEPLLPDSQSEVWIVKDAIGSDCRGTDGLPYTVWKKDALADALPGFLAALPAGRELVISEFIHTSDPYAGLADHVVHKMHFFSSCDGSGFAVRPYGSNCQKIICGCNHSLLQDKSFLPLKKYIGQRHYTTGHVEQTEYFNRFLAGLEFMAGSRLIFSVDFIIPPDGIPRYLESNKLAATFAESFDSSRPPLIDAYPFLPL